MLRPLEAGLQEQASNHLELQWLKALPVGTVGMSMLAVPVIGVAAAAVKLGENPPPLEMIGMVLILCGIVLISILDLNRK